MGNRLTQVHLEGWPLTRSVCALPFRSCRGCRNGKAQSVSAGWRQEGHLAHKKFAPEPLFTKIKGNWPTQVDLEKWPLQQSCMNVRVCINNNQ